MAWASGGGRGEVVGFKMYFEGDLKGFAEVLAKSCQR